MKISAPWKKRRLLLAVVALLALYTISYLIVSRKGFYEPVAYGLLQGRDGHPILAPKAVYGYNWMPFEHQGADGTWVKFNFYFPMLALDRAVWHRSDRVDTIRYRTKNYFDYEKLEYSEIQ